MAWTVEQQQAIDLEGKNIIVSAGAGSGKTAVLTARVQRKLLSGIHIHELLVLTFTNAAAAEMKERIRNTIRKTPELKEELEYIDGAYITTFDAYSLALVKKYHTRLNITNRIAVSDEVMVSLEKKRILEEIFEEHYLSPKSNFTHLIQDFCLKDDQDLKKAILSMYQKIELKYNKSSYLKEYSNQEIISSALEEYVSVLSEKQKCIQDLFLELGSYFDDSFVVKMEDNFQKLLSAKTYDDFHNACDFQTLTVPRGSGEEAKALKVQIFEIAKEIKSLCFYSSLEEAKEEILSTTSYQEALLEILREFDERLDSYKREHEIFTFTDIARLAIKVVEENDDIREELKNEFQEILVDEYQDTSDLQEYFLSLISHNNLYMVGDIKQSIYRFRNANPTIFMNKYNTYRDTDFGEKIDLLKNFRSRREVLDDINLLFDPIMDEEYGGADYPKSHRMNFGNTTYEEEGKTKQNYHMEFLTYDKDSLGKLNSSEEEAFLIGEDIKEKIKNHYMIFDKDQKVLREANYSDFVILLDKGKDFDLYKKIFEYLHIPLTILKEESLQKENDILVLKNLLKLLICMKKEDYGVDFQYAFFSVSRSFLYPTEDSVLYDTFIHKNYLESPLCQKCMPFLEKMDSMNLSQFFLDLMDEFHYEEKILTIGKVHYFEVRFEYLYELCKNYESMGKTIYDFVPYLEDMQEEELDLKFNISVNRSNSCSIMTIHKSKGLEFPICYFAGLSPKFNMTELNDRILYDNQYGIILPKVDHSYKDTILKTLLKRRVRQEEISERIRLLYVALTRAKEKMIFVLPKIEEEFETRSVSSYEKEHYSSFASILKSIVSIILPYISLKDIIGSKEYLYVNKKEIPFSKGEEIPVFEISIPVQEKKSLHFSKNRLKMATKEEVQLMKFGEVIHRILEEIDFNHYDLSIYDIDSFVKGKIEDFIHSDFMKDKLSLKMYKEYEFMTYDDNTEYHGIIDLLLEDNKQMIIVDYKLKNIDDLNYDKQLNGYRHYIEKKTGKKTLCYLYSIMDSKLREVECD